MPTTPVHVGVDIAKGTVAVRLLNQNLTYANTPAGHAAFIKTLPGAAHIICEATGGYEQALVQALHGAGIAVSVINPRQVRDYARARGLLCKTDRVDAQILADYGATLKPEPDQASSAVQLKLAALVSARQDLLEVLRAEASRAEHLSVPVLKRQHAARVRLLEKQLAALDRELASIISADSQLADKAARLQQVAGVGPVLAHTVLALIPELGQLGAPQAAALAGVAPFACDSGEHKGRRHIFGGRSAVCRVLYMAAVSASQHNRILRDY